MWGYQLVTIENWSVNHENHSFTILVWSVNFER
jgi:hypothetical protein